MYYIERRTQGTMVWRRGGIFGNVDDAIEFGWATTESFEVFRVVNVKGAVVWDMTSGWMR